MSANVIRRPTAGIIVIGDEILKGQTQDVNTYFLAGRLKQLGVELRRVSVISDHKSVIADEVRHFAEQYTFVFTSGGVGPTHDDVTFEGIALAFEDQIHRHPGLVQIIDAWTKLNPGAYAQSRYKLAEVPSSAQLNFASPEKVAEAKRQGLQVVYPLVSVRNVFVFPGIPELLRKGFDFIAVDLISDKLPETTSSVAEVFVTKTELFITDALNDLVSKHKDVTFGSYPELTHNYYKTKLTVEAETKAQVDQVVAEIHRKMPTIDYDKTAQEKSMDKIEAFKGNCDDADLVKVINEALVAVGKAFDDFGPGKVMISVNGGKDCVVMVHLIHAYFQKHVQKGSERLQAIYIREKDPFKEVEAFISQMERMYDLELRRVEGPMKQALINVLNGQTDKACFLGMRQGDPGSENQSHFAPTDGDWPPMMRVNPIINWNYHQIWKFIRGLSLPYPSLYDQGYTSLGNKKNTKPNPHLKVSSESGVVSYKPAHELEDGRWERDGRQ